jgi:hypothetical protein
MRQASDEPQLATVQHGIYLIDIDSGTVRHLTPPQSLLSGPAEPALYLPTPVARSSTRTFVRDTSGK